MALKVLVTTFLVEDDTDAARVGNEIAALATERSCHLILTDIYKAHIYHLECADELDIGGWCIRCNKEYINPDKPVCTECERKNSS